MLAENVSGKMVHRAFGGDKIPCFSSSDGIVPVGTMVEWRIPVTVDLYPVNLYGHVHIGAAWRQGFRQRDADVPGAIPLGSAGWQARGSTAIRSPVLPARFRPGEGGVTLHDELALMVERRHTAAEALQSATINPARYLDKLDEFGTIGTNKRADLVLVDADPLADIRSTARISAVVLNGRLHDRGELDRFLARAEAVAKTVTAPRVPTVALVITSRDADVRFAGTWEAEFPNLTQSIVLDLEVRATVLTGKLRAAGTQPMQTFEGTVKGNRVIFKLVSPDGDRVVTLTGDLAGDEIAFIRQVDVRPGGAPGGQGLFGVRGPSGFTARRQP